MIFINNKYTSIYYSIIEKSKNRKISGYTEKHHIIPKSLGGSNKSNNLVKLTAREHYICHILLVLMTFGKNQMKMIHAATAFINWKTTKHDRKFHFNSKTYQSLKEKRSEMLKHEMSKPENKLKSSNGAKKLWASDEFRAKASATRKNLWKDEEYISKMKNRTRTFKQVSINGVTYMSLRAAAEDLKLDPSTVSKRCSSTHEKFSDWNYL